MNTTGNVRELSNRIERFVLLNDEHELTQNFNHQRSQINSKGNNPDFDMPEKGFSWDDFERQCLANALKIN
ncbi:MAG: hypothetical protein HRT38_14305 [Alteromonadaceae bacterium]|nr:hypothetical protein [Alteromonadaceae bacterium]